MVVAERRRTVGQPQSKVGAGPVKDGHEVITHHRDVELSHHAHRVAVAVDVTIAILATELDVFVHRDALGDGPVSQLWYAFRLFFLPLGVFGVALATVATTSVAEEAARGDRSALVARACESVSAAWMLTGASAVGLWVLAEPVCTVV